MKSLSLKQQMEASKYHHFFFTKNLSRRLMKNSCRSLFFLPILLAFTTAIFIFLHSWSTSNLYIHPSLTQVHVNIPRIEYSTINPQENVRIDVVQKFDNPSVVSEESENFEKNTSMEISSSDIEIQEFRKAISIHPSSSFRRHDFENPLPQQTRNVAPKIGQENDDVFHDRSVFMEEYKQMKKKLKIYAYPHKKSDPFANVLLPVDDEPGGNYASESYFKKSLFRSHFLTNNPSEADLFFLPFSIASLRHDKRIGVGGIQNYVRNYIRNISRSYPYWNRTGGSDHFYVACHSVGRTAMEKVVEVKINAIQVVCSSSYFLSGYVSHKDASIPQVWPRKGKPPTRLPSLRTTLAFYAGAMNSRVRESLVKIWKNDSEISVHHTRLKTPYSEALLGSKFCIHAKGFEVNTARVSDALYYGCVPVVLADHYDLPFADILKWDSFSVVVSSMDIPLLKKILQEIVVSKEYLKLQNNVMRVQRHFQWHNIPVDYDAFHMVMYELWLRRSHMRIPL